MTRVPAWLWGAGAFVLVCAQQDGERTLQRVLFERLDVDGVVRHVATLDPVLFPGSRWLLEEPRVRELETALDALLDDSNIDALARVLLQRDLWPVHDWLASVAHAEPDTPRGVAASKLRPRVARAMAVLALDAEALVAIEAELRAALEHAPDELGGLLSSNGPWVRLAPVGDDITTLAPAHHGHFGARAAFSVHVRVPGGREAALDYLARLAAAPHVVQRGEATFLAPDLPQPPVGTTVTLVRRTVHVDETGERRVLPLFELVQLRTFTRTEPPRGYVADHGEAAFVDGATWSAFQSVRELELDRAGLLAGRSALREVPTDEPDLSTFGSHRPDPFEHPPSYVPPTRLDTCVSCHGAPGIHSVVAFTGALTGPGGHLDVALRANPRALGVDVPGGAERRALAAGATWPELAALLETWR